jgi:hypothetical protein
MLQLHILIFQETNVSLMDELYKKKGYKKLHMPVEGLQKTVNASFLFL